ncbi:MAG: anaerobic ribonucleoside-triphosphate reductase, partial [Actinomycetota bacterium]|nr:anaerobic ribonucleoside-triphosphate reductase [Actinomycetota bacterium]
LKEIEKHLETNDLAFNGFCHDCDAPVEVLCSVNKKGEVIISGGAMYNPIMGTPPTEHTFFKCDNCFGKDKTLRNFIPCEIFSRVVGYLRPVAQWNIGKKEEFKQRKEYVV